MDLQLDQIRSFLALVQHEGFHAAAQALGVSQSAVSQHLRKLEESLGAQLLVRTPRGSGLTKAGALFLPYARSLIELSERAAIAVRGETLAVGASTNVGTYLLQSYLRRFTATLGLKLRLHVRLDPNPSIAEALERGEIEVGLLEWWSDRVGFRSSVWRSEPLVVIVSPTHPWATRKAVDADELSSEVLIGGEAGTGTATVLRAALGKRADSLQTRLTLGSTEAVKRAVRESLGVSIVLAASVEDELRHGSLCALELEGISLRKNLKLVLREDAPRNGLAVAFANQLLAPA